MNLWLVLNKILLLMINNRDENLRKYFEYALFIIFNRNFTKPYLFIIFIWLVDIEGLTYLIETRITIAGGFLNSQTIETIVFNFVRDKLLDQVQPEKYLSESMAQVIVYARDSDEMGQFIHELKLHDDGKVFRLK